MNAVALVLAALLGLVLIGVGSLEAFQYRNQRWFSMFRIRPQDHDAVRIWVMFVGFYNIVYGLGALTGVILTMNGQTAAGAALVAFVCISHIVLAVVLLVVERKLWRNSISEAVLPVAILIAMAF
ncbi:DUF1304 family protein [Agromyces sp. SYSU K20354]|uniref:DUF1304 family protein n=1 Tax=Agromyces cavernae TaxID=2898659 RepID=UPI001E53CAE1|nr:DUF1304 family protein [Agromyces cavernae]MCD2442934.1 DUF1304 family protein [Agromyces cavernae]